MGKEEELKKTAELLRHELGSINLSDVWELEKKELSQEDLDARVADVEMFYEKWGEDAIKLFMLEQLKAMAMIGVDKTFASGTINGFKLIDEWFKEKSKVSLSRFEKEGEEPNLGEI